MSRDVFHVVGAIGFDAEVVHPIAVGVDVDVERVAPAGVAVEVDETEDHVIGSGRTIERLEFSDGENRLISTPSLAIEIVAVA